MRVFWQLRVNSSRTRQVEGEVNSAGADEGGSVDCLEVAVLIVLVGSPDGRFAPSGSQAQFGALVLGARCLLGEGVAPNASVMFDAVG